jgi:hypothetical protein
VGSSSLLVLAAFAYGLDQFVVDGRGCLLSQGPQTQRSITALFFRSG